MGTVYLHVGGLVAAGFDASGMYLLAISHNGRGVFDTRTWQRVARDDSKAYPLAGVGLGIGPIEGQRVTVSSVDFETGTLTIQHPVENVSISYEAGMITVTRSDKRDR